MFHDEHVISILYMRLNSGKPDYVPHYVTQNNYLQRKYTKVPLPDGTDSRFYKATL